MRGAGRSWYATLTLPPGTPPAWVFGPVWTVLYIAQGLAGWLVWRRTGGGPALRAWGWQLAANAAWAPAFFGLHNPALALLISVLMLLLIALTARAFAARRRLAAWLMLPYLGWTGYATWLNAGIWWLNPS